MFFSVLGATNLRDPLDDFLKKMGDASSQPQPDKSVPPSGPTTAEPGKVK